MRHMATNQKLTVLEHCSVAPPPGTVVEKSLPLTFFDILWLSFSHIQRLIFYEFPCSKTHFMETLIPNLKDSLSLALKHFFPLAGHLVLSSSSSKPQIRYEEGDSVSLTFSESESESESFSDFIGNHPRKAMDFHPFVPQLPLVTKSSDSFRVPVFSLQVTLFPNKGLCVGLTNHHAVGDANSIFNFMKAWALITRCGGDGPFLAGGSQPIFDRTLIKDPKGLDSIFLSQLGTTIPVQQVPTNSDKFRATFIMSRTNIQRLKSLVMAKRPGLVHVSTFTVICAYIWVCMVKSKAAIGEEGDEDEPYHFICTGDTRARLDPPIPASYFGNCIFAACIAAVNCKKLAGDEGFIFAVEAIGEDIRERLYNEEGMLKNAETFLLDVKEINWDWERTVGVAGSPKFNYYDIDFGWGKPKKFEFVSIDITGAMSLNGCRDLDGGIEVGLSLPKAQMDAFAASFAEGL
ncbi:unnamed protein product [Ilex paraguariensis]|uniref:Anthocyanin 5-aromatic acyltransferase n=1 Tax=Ilex paraguariensis TaxID=185542 RepID=A0ABC8QQQ1_9AQUA